MSTQRWGREHIAQTTRASSQTTTPRRRCTAARAAVRTVLRGRHALARSKARELHHIVSKPLRHAQSVTQSRLYWTAPGGVCCTGDVAAVSGGRVRVPSRPRRLVYMLISAMRAHNSKKQLLTKAVATGTGRERRRTTPQLRLPEKVLRLHRPDGTRSQGRRGMLRVGARRSVTRALSQHARCASVPAWATVDPWKMSGAEPAVGKNLCGGVWSDAKSTHDIIDPLNGEAFIKVPNTSVDEIGPFVERMANCPRTGLHNPLRDVERYNMLGEVMARGAQELNKPEVNEFFAKLIQRLVPKSWAQAKGEPTVTRASDGLGPPLAAAQSSCARAAERTRPRAACA
jgi:hypothetical protein